MWREVARVGGDPPQATGVLQDKAVEVLEAENWRRKEREL